ncbi:hypothetical protein [Aliiruegeria sabulilitoris]|uniref:hypothetical protein n=1 Tax=Aliiruegeria sabulilitoris TaxID=1510458 RepID=UPI0012E353A4|nr:hypothetical protein [Aliiruegeria sabulilitoris]NDR58153.1 hypothetical protein [Pseudoruegeria sp. M32A2M]
MYSLKMAGIAAALICLAAPLTAQSPKPVEAVTISDIRGMRFCEVLLIFEDRVEIYNTSASAGCPEETWEKLDTAAIAEDHGAKAAQLNGPHFWTMDAQTVGLGAEADFGGIAARYGATLPLSALGAGKGADPYKPYTSAKLQTFLFEAGKPVYELVDAAGNTYILNAYGNEVKDGDPANLAEQLSPAEGWHFRTQILEQDMTLAGTADTPVDMVGDDLHQYYTRLRGDE